MLQIQGKQPNEPYSCFMHWKQDVYAFLCTLRYWGNGTEMLIFNYVLEAVRTQTFCPSLQKVTQLDVEQDLATLREVDLSEYYPIVRDIVPKHLLRMKLLRMADTADSRAFREMAAKASKTPEDTHVKTHACASQGTGSDRQRAQSVGRKSTEHQDKSRDRGTSRYCGERTSHRSPQRSTYSRYQVLAQVFSTQLHMHTWKMGTHLDAIA